MELTREEIGRILARQAGPNKSLLTEDMDALCSMALAYIDATQWRDISTAPKDGTTFLACDGKARCIVHYERGFLHVTHDTEGYAWEDYTPTQWLPLPATKEA